MTSIFTNPSQMRRRGVVGACSRFALRTLGWQTNVPTDVPDQCVLIVYPHTSNWDFPLAMLCKFASGLEISYLGKDSLFRSPMGWFFRMTGGIPVDRTNAKGVVPQMVERFQSASRLRIGMAPEGTRAYVPHLRSGFYHIAIAAKVPLVLATIDYGRKRIGILETLALSGDETTDMTQIANAFAGVRGLNPNKMGALKL